MRIEYIKDAEPYFKGTVVDVDSEVGANLIERGVAKEVDPRSDLRNVAAEVSQDGMSLTDKRKKGLAPAGFEGDEEEADEDAEDEYSSMSVDELKDELTKKDLPVTGKKADLLKRLREAK